MEPDDKAISMKVDPSDALAGLPDEVKDAPIGPMIGVSAIALNLAMKYADINTVQDGVLYQQYKMEGRNMQGLHLAYVLAIAKQIEAHLVDGNRRVAQLLVASALAVDDVEEKSETEEEPQEPSAPSDSQ